MPATLCTHRQNVSFTPCIRSCKCVHFAKQTTCVRPDLIVHKRRNIECCLPGTIARWTLQIDQQLSLGITLGKPRRELLDKCPRQLIDAHWFLVSLRVKYTTL